jgi:hypothetical protein
VKLIRRFGGTGSLPKNIGKILMIRGNVKSFVYGLEHKKGTIMAVRCGVTDNDL